MKLRQWLRSQLENERRDFGGLRQIEAKAGVNRGILSRFLSGERDCNLENAEKLLDYFGVTFEHVRPKRPPR